MARSAIEIWRQYATAKDIGLVISPSTGNTKAADQIMIPVRVVDVRLIWGREDVLIQPVVGIGRAWVHVARVKVLPDGYWNQIAADDASRDRQPVLPDDAKA